MIIKLTEVADTKLGKSAAKEIRGEKVGSNEPWKRAFFANNKDLRDKISDFEMGDIINVVLEKQGEFYNIVDIKEATDDEIEVAEKYAKKPVKSEAVPPGNTSVRRFDGGSRGDDTNRSAAVYLARELVNMTTDLSKLTATECACLCVELADMVIYPYIKDGAIYNLPKTDKPKKAKPAKDPLEPPEVED